MSDDLATKYRPEKLKGVIGQEATIASIKSVLEKGTSHSFIFTGPSGTGKTTLARIIARLAGAEKGGIVEVDAASNTGVDAMREVLSTLQFRGLNGSSRVYIVDECHKLSSSAWDSMLKSVEEPPPNVWWFFCSTEPAKIPATIKTRCVQYELKAVSAELIFELLKKVAAAETYTTSEDVLYLISEKCGGSPRRALTALAQCSSCNDRKEAAAILKAATEDGEAFQLAQMLAKGTPDWPKLMALCEQLKDIDGETIRYTIVGYFTKILLSAKDNEAAQRGLAVLDAFSRPYPQGAKIYPVILSLGELVFTH